MKRALYLFMVFAFLGLAVQAQAQNACSINYTINTQWGLNDAIITVVITNTSSVPINGWTLTWGFQDNQIIQSMWNATYSQAQSVVTVKNLSYNAIIPPGGNVTFGFHLAYIGTNSIPINFALNGLPCTVMARGTPTPVPTATPTPVPTSRTDSCAVSYVVTNQWATGATVNVTIRNTGAIPINGWTLTWTFTGNQRITDLWNGTFTQTGTAVNVTNASYNNMIPPGGSVTFGFNLSYSGTNSNPTTFVLNGITCR